MNQIPWKNLSKTLSHWLKVWLRLRLVLSLQKWIQFLSINTAVFFSFSFINLITIFYGINWIWLRTLLVFAAARIPRLYGFWIPSSPFATSCGTTTSGWSSKSWSSCCWRHSSSSSSTPCRATPSKRWWAPDRSSLSTGSYTNFRRLLTLVSWPVGTSCNWPIISCHRLSS